jgi:hypothetical protein
MVLPRIARGETTSHACSPVETPTRPRGRLDRTWHDLG